MEFPEIIKKLESLGSRKWVESNKRAGINTDKIIGVSNSEIRKIAKETGKDHELALKLWDSGIHEARVLACHVDKPEKVTKKQMDEWADDFDNWGLCDACCTHLFDKTPFAYEKIVRWSKSRKEFVKRAAFALIASLAVHDKKADDKKFTDLFPIIRRESTDERNFVKKAVNWALRQAGKRNKNLNKKAIILAEEIEKTDSKTAKWIARDALQELQSSSIQEKLKRN